MNRETQRQIARLRRLADIILTYKDFAQGHPDYCTVGLGLRLNNGKIGKIVKPPTGFDLLSVRLSKAFAKKFGISEKTVYNLYWGNFNEINPRVKSDYTDGTIRRKVSGLLNYIANRKEKGLAI